MLRLLVQRPGRVFTRDELLDKVWDDDSDSFDRTVDAHIKTLRAKLKAVAPELGADPHAARHRLCAERRAAAPEPLSAGSRAPMTKRNRIFIGILLIFAAGIAFLLYRVVADLDPRYRESAEESLVETAQLMASLVEQDARAGAIDTARLEPLFKSVYAAQLRGADLQRRQAPRRAARCTSPTAPAACCSTRWAAPRAPTSRSWRDVSLALRGEYGARTTPDVEDDPRTSVMYVGAPVRWNNEIIGAVSRRQAGAELRPVRRGGAPQDAVRGRWSRWSACWCWR